MSRLLLLSGLGSAALLARGVGTSIPSPAGGLRAVGLSFIGLSGLESGMLPSNPALCDLSNAICCCCCAPPRRYPGSCRTHHHHPSPSHSLTSISALLTRPLAVCASFVPSPCALCAGRVRRLKRPLRPHRRRLHRRRRLVRRRCRRFQHRCRRADRRRRRSRRRRRLSRRRRPFPHRRRSCLH